MIQYNKQEKSTQKWRDKNFFQTRVERLRQNKRYTPGRNYKTHHGGVKIY